MIKVGSQRFDLRESQRFYKIDRQTYWHDLYIARLSDLKGVCHEIFYLQFFS